MIEILIRIGCWIRSYRAHGWCNVEQDYGKNPVFSSRECPSVRPDCTLAKEKLLLVKKKPVAFTLLCTHIWFSDTIGIDFHPGVYLPSTKLGTYAALFQLRHLDLEISLKVKTC